MCIVKYICNFFIVLLIMSFSHFALAGIEVSLQGGMHLNKDIQLKDTVGEAWENPDRNMWIIGGDLLYRIPIINVGAGIRLQRSFMKDPSESTNAQTETDVNLMQQPSGFYADRVAFLGSYRLTVAWFFIGPVVTIDFFKSLKFEQSRGNDESLQVTSKGWTLGSGQLALETGIKLSNFFVKAELGYSFLSFGDLECNNEAQCFGDVDPENRTVKLSAPYMLIGLGLSFL